MAAATPVHLVVLFGGQSAEHDVSCTTAAHVVRAIDPDRYRVTVVGITRDGRWTTADSARDLLAAGKVADRLDPDGRTIEPSAALAVEPPAVIIPLLHGPLGEDGTVQGLLELAGLPYVGSGVLASAMCMDKAVAKAIADQAGIPQPRHRAVRADQLDESTIAGLVAELGRPLFVKPANMGSSIGVSKASTDLEIAAALDLAFTYDEWVVVEEAVRGREIEVAVLGNLDPQASVPGEIVPGAEFYDYDDKYQDGARILVPAPLSPTQVTEVQGLALRAVAALRCEGLARVDFFFEEHGRGFLLNEVNTMPGFTPISMFPKLWIASGMTYPGLLDELVSLALERHGRRRRTTTH